MATDLHQVNVLSSKSETAIFAIFTGSNPQYTTELLYVKQETW